MITEAGRELDALVAERVFGHKGLGYYGPSLDGSTWEHGKSVWYATKREAQDCYRRYWEMKHKDNPRGYMDPDDEDAFYLLRWEDGWGPLSVPEYSTSIAAAWEVVEKLATTELYKGHDITICGHIGKWSVDFASDDAKNYTVDAASLPLAICLAALKAVGHVD